MIVVADTAVSESLYWYVSRLAGVNDCGGWYSGEQITLLNPAEQSQCVVVIAARALIIRPLPMCIIFTNIYASVLPRGSSRFSVKQVFDNAKMDICPGYFDNICDEKTKWMHSDGLPVIDNQIVCVKSIVRCIYICVVTQKNNENLKLWAGMGILRE